MLFCMGLNPIVNAQDTLSGIVTEQIWLDYKVSQSLSEKVNVYGEIGARTVFPNEWYRYVIRPSVSYKLPQQFIKNSFHNSKLYGGFALFFTDNNTESNRLEIRPFQGFKLTWPDRPKINIWHYVRLEERFDIETANWENTFGLRLRYQAEMVLFLKGEWIRFNAGVYLPIGLELFWNLIGVKQFNDAVRITPGIGKEFSPSWKAEFRVGYFYTRQTVQDVFGTNDIVFRIRVYHTLLKQ